jgi:predicted acyl esterase
VYQTEPLARDLTLAGPMRAKLVVRTTGTDADWIVKIIDVFPDNYEDGKGHKLGGYQQHVRSEVFRGRFRNDYQKPEPFEPNGATTVAFDLQDVLHTFRPGHRLMVQIHSTWFPLVDRNPQKFMPNIFQAREEDFTAAIHQVHGGHKQGSMVEIGVWRPAK